MRRSRLVAATAALLAAGAPLALSTPASAGDTPSGSAYAVSVHATLLGNPAVTIDPLPLAAYPTGEDKSVAEIGPQAAGLVTGRVLTASSNLAGSTLLSKAAVAEVEVGNIVDGMVPASHLLRASLVSAQCTAQGGDLVGNADLAELNVLGTDIDVDAAPNTTVNVLDTVRVVVNEQIRQGPTLTVNAVHVIVEGPVSGVVTADIVLSQAVCSAGGGPTTTTTPSPTGPTTPTTTGTAPSEPGTPSTSVQPPRDSTTPSSGASTEPGVVPVANSGDLDDSGDLANTGVGGVGVLIAAAVILLAAGAIVLVRSRRRTAAEQPRRD